jgi:uncharacterized protein (DUF305 family)
MTVNQTRRAFLQTLIVLPVGAALLAACGSNNAGMSNMPGMSNGAMPTATVPAGGTSSAGMPGMGGMGTPGMTGMAEYDQSFIDQMVTHHQAAIDMAKVAQRKGEHAEIKTLANAIVGAQDGEITKMKAWRKAWYGSDQIPASTMGGMAGMGGMDVDLAQLENAQPFDKAFIDAMTPHHQSAIAMAREAQTKAMHQEIKDLAGQIIAAQQRELDQMQAWRAQWYPG